MMARMRGAAAARVVFPFEEQQRGAFARRENRRARKS